MAEGKKPSEQIQEFVDFMEESKIRYESAKKKCEELDSFDRLIYWAHKFEFAKDKAERNRFATQYQNERRERRRYKDICDTYETVYNFMSSDNNKGALKRMKGMINIQKKEEDYVNGNRIYKAGDRNDSD